jgi:hypothetical protein
MEEVSHKQIYDRLVAVESKVDHLDKKTDDVVSAFNAAKGAFLVLDWIGRAVKPILWIAGAGAVIYGIWEKWWHNK